MGQGVRSSFPSTMAICVLLALVDGCSLGIRDLEAKGSSKQGGIELRRWPGYGTTRTRRRGWAVAGGGAEVVCSGCVGAGRKRRCLGRAQVMIGEAAQATRGRLEQGVDRSRE
ncbi:hypothetical protein PR202_gb18361 [Eleusine coracana subsp. coracana]|uniref:Secreted protein n=1 Tax=Eleusine coracana subsp. coracana TaxID=191504 RepID=A0AAV5F5X9_ELECO|nr:hypothetical protein PR202_gb18361 [Eleusine coracana subsp. coracana]